MKKTILAIALAGLLAACNNSANTTADKKDSLDSIASEKKDRIDSSAQQKVNAIDSNAKEQKAMVDSNTKEKKAMLDKRDSAMRRDTAGGAHHSQHHK
jgi:hypothetical protein